MNPKRIVIDGKSYNSVNEMPPEVRRQYEEAMRAVRSGIGDAEAGETPNMPNASTSTGGLANLFADNNKDGMPDVMDNIPAVNVFGGMNIVVDGVTYNRLEDLPPEARARYEQAMGFLDRDRNGIPDFLERFVDAPSQPTASASSYGTRTPSQAQPSFASSQRKPISSAPAIAPDTSNGWAIALVGIILLFLCAAGAAGVWYFFLRG
jgi:hypothetical protein